MRRGLDDGPLLPRPRMGKPRRACPRFHVRLSQQALEILGRLSEAGIYGLTPEDVATRMVDRALEPFAKPVCPKCGTPFSCSCGLGTGT